jgi:hypothetical protein
MCLLIHRFPHGEFGRESYSFYADFDGCSLTAFSHARCRLAQRLGVQKGLSRLI